MIKGLYYILMRGKAAAVLLLPRLVHVRTEPLKYGVYERVAAVVCGKD